MIIGVEKSIGPSGIGGDSPAPLLTQQPAPSP